MFLFVLLLTVPFAAWGSQLKSAGLIPRLRDGKGEGYEPALYLSVRSIPVRQPTLLPPASFRRTLLYNPHDLRSLGEEGCLQLSFPSVRVDLDFA